MGKFAIYPEGRFDSDEAGYQTQKHEPRRQSRSNVQEAAGNLNARMEYGSPRQKVRTAISDAQGWFKNCGYKYPRS